MVETGMPRGSAVAGIFLGLSAFCRPLSAQPDVRISAGDVTDSRYSGGHQRGSLALKVKVRGDGMEGVKALRFHLSDARDDLGNALLPEEEKPPEFRDVRGEAAQEQLSFRNPAREASVFRVTGRLELFIPSRDPNAVVKVSRALATPGRPLASPGLKAAGVRVIVLPRTGMPGNTVSLKGRTADIRRIHTIRILRSDGREIPVGSRGWLSDGEETLMTLEAAEAVPKNAALVFTLLTEKARAEVPFDLKEIPLP